ncbi:MAG: hypothetical protein PVG39_26065 [Desulfobacteraceae bacterium]|jgi:hypothetical protein
MMSIKIENSVNRPVYFRLNSGISLLLAPGATSEEILDSEIAGNSKVQRLRTRKVIEIREATKKSITSKKNKPQQKKRKK